MPEPEILPVGRGGSPTLAWEEYRWVIERAMAADPRSAQQVIGPSELGTSCLKCLARKLAQVPQKPGGAWLPQIGTCVHAWLEEVFSSVDGPLAGRWLTEVRVKVGTIGGVEVWGTCDLYDTVTAEVTDWKIVGAATLKRAASHGPTPVYRTQAHLYGMGLVAAGHPVDLVRIMYLPRNATSLAAAVHWCEPYDPAVALAALERATALSLAIAAVGADPIIDSSPAEPGCFSCARYPTPGATPDSLAAGPLSPDLSLLMGTSPTP